MGHMTFVDRLLSNQISREKALEFVRVFMAYAGKDYRPQPSFGQAEMLDSILHEARSGVPATVTVAEYLAVPEKREFAKVFLICLISSFHPFQPNKGSEWKPYQELIDDLLENCYIMDPVASAGMDRDDLAEEDAGEYLLEDTAERLVWKMIQDQGGQTV